MEKLFWSFLANSLDRYQDGDSKTRDALVEAVTVHMNEAVIGTKKHPAQWTFPLKDNKGGGKTVEPRNMTGAHAKKCIVGLKSLATVVFSPSFDEMSQNPKHTRSTNETWETSWHDIMDTFVPLMEQLHQHEDFSDEQVLSFHCLAARFMHQYCDLFQGEGITNYIHLIGAGHITYYLHKYRTLNKFCQQGWEALNQLLKQFYFNNTNHGGSLGNSSGDMIKGEHCKPLIKLCQRRTMWLLGLGDTFFEDEDVIKEMEEAKEADNPNVI